MNVTRTPTFTILGARNLGGAIADHLTADGWVGAAIAQTEETIEAVRGRGIVGIRADAADPEQLAEALARAASELGRIDVLINAVSVARFDPHVPWGGGPLVEGSLDRWRTWSAAVAEQAFVFFSESARFLTTQGGPAKIVQIGNSAMREATTGNGLWAAGWHSVRALASAARQELAASDIQVALVAILGPIRSPKTEAMVAKLPPAIVNDQDDVAAKVAAFTARDQLEAELEVRPN